MVVSFGNKCFEERGELFQDAGNSEVRLHQLLFGALRTEDVGAVCDEALAHQGPFAHGADEAVVVPVPILEGDEASATNACNYEIFFLEQVLRFIYSFIIIITTITVVIIKLGVLDFILFQK